MPEEDEVLINAWKAAIGPSGQVRFGFFKEAHQLFPHRTFWSVKNRIGYFVRKGILPKQRQRATYIRLRLSEADKGWLAGILDGEGSVRGPRTSKRLGLKNGFNVQIILGYNNTGLHQQCFAAYSPHRKD